MFSAKSGGFNVLFGNRAFSDYFAILGGRFNKTGDSASGDPALGGLATVGGGAFNVASGREASISGGTTNTASGSLSSISGGASNTASVLRTSIAGGDGVTCVGGGAVMCAEGNSTSPDQAGRRR